MRSRIASVVALVSLGTLPLGCGGSDPPPPLADGGDVDVIVLLPDSEVGTPDADVIPPPDADVTPPPDAASAPDAFPPGICGTNPLSVLYPGVPEVGNTTGLANETAGACGGASAGEQPFVFMLSGPADVIVSTDHPATDFNTSVYVRSVCDDPGTELGCAGGGMLGDALLVTDLAAGDYFVLVDGVAGATGNFEITLTVIDIVPEGSPCDLTGMTNRCATGSSCVDGPIGPTCVGVASACEAGAIVVTPPATVTGSTAGVADTYPPACSFDGGSGEVVYRVDVMGAFDLIATATPTNFMVDNFDAILSAETVCGDPATEVDCADSPMASAAETITVLDAAGTYFLLVDGYNGTAGEFSLDVTLRPVRGAGDACDPAGSLDRCGGGLACLDDGAGGTTCQDPFVGACSGAVAALIGAPNTGTLGGGASALGPDTCAFDAGTDEDVYYVDLAVPSYLVVNETVGGTGMQIYVRGADTCNPIGEVGCDTGGIRSIVTDVLSPGRWYVIVDGTGSYSLDVAVGTPLGMGDTCDSSSATARCADGSFCLDAICTSVTLVDDVAPNAAFCDAQGPFSSDFVVNGTITGGTDYDNFELTLTGPTDLYLETSDGLGCSVNTIIEVFDAMGMTCTELDLGMPAPFDSDDNGGPEGICSRLTLTGLAAGTYYVRIRRPGGATTGPYFLLVDFL